MEQTSFLLKKLQQLVVICGFLNLIFWVTTFFAYIYNTEKAKLFIEILLNEYIILVISGSFCMVYLVYYTWHNE